MTAAEARQEAAIIALSRLTAVPMECYAAARAADWPLIETELRLIETWIRRRAVGQDRILTRQMERPTGGKVGMSPKQARKLRIPDGTKRKP